MAIVLQNPLMIVISAPSGAGKSTLCREVMARVGPIRYSISCTTRPPRGSEVDGCHYYFLSPEEFAVRVKAGEFLEHAMVHGNAYGTLKSTVMNVLNAGVSVLLDIDVQGAAQIRKALAQADAQLKVLREHYVDIFVRPPDLDTLRLRLEGRAEDSPDVIRTRLENAEKEMSAQDDYRYVIVNDQLDDAVERLVEILVTEGGKAI